MGKICKICGKSRFMFSWEDICYTCKQKKDLAEMQQKIKKIKKVTLIHSQIAISFVHIVVMR
ncbi:hypothetical protein RUMCAL_00291 [Ruminococcus callidus ATCC 27760]|jgi:hypothetical protein|uniref:Uncharacterized protein n=1 Tax=Ruminococcus callidus ATCC 27760 TaxID=411473 RepID=U2M654_9FIRM|nr:hypothetical protein RUMCAL_00291 [Ruminococcus callidus ATCC 27760]